MEEGSRTWAHFVRKYGVLIYSDLAARCHQFPVWRDNQADFHSGIQIRCRKSPFISSAYDRACGCVFVCVCVCSLSYFGSLVLEPDLHNPDAQTGLCCQGLPYLGSGFREGGEVGGGGVKNRGKETERRSVQGQKKSVSPHRSTLKQGGKDQTFMNHSTFLNVCTFGFFLNKLFGLNPAKLYFFHWGVISLSFLKIQITKLDTRVFCPHSKAERFLLHSGFSKIGGSDRKQLIMANKKTTPPIKM